MNTATATRTPVATAVISRIANNLNVRTTTENSRNAGLLISKDTDGGVSADWFLGDDDVTRATELRHINKLANHLTDLGYIVDRHYAGLTVHGTR